MSTHTYTTQFRIETSDMIHPVKVGCKHRSRLSSRIHKQGHPPTPAFRRTHRAMTRNRKVLHYGWAPPIQGSERQLRSVATVSIRTLSLSNCAVSCPAKCHHQTRAAHQRGAAAAYRAVESPQASHKNPLMTASSSAGCSSPSKCAASDMTCSRTSGFCPVHDLRIFAAKVLLP